MPYSGRVYHQEYREANRERLREYHREWSRNNRFRCQVYAANKRARKAGVEGTLTPEHWQAVVVAHQHGCALCSSPYEQMDHEVPLGWGGANSIDNVRPLCGPCHAAKTKREAASFKHLEKAK